MPTTIRKSPQRKAAPTGDTGASRGANRAACSIPLARPHNDHPLIQGTDEQGPFDHLQAALDNLVDAGILALARRPDIEYPTWPESTDLRFSSADPLRSLTGHEKTHLDAQVFAFIGAALS